MDTEEVIRQAESLRARVRPYARRDYDGNYGQAAQAQVCEFLRNYANPKSAFLKQAEAAHGSSLYLVTTLDSIVESFIEYLHAGLATGVSPERRAQLEVVSDLLGQANSLLEDNRYHPAAAAILIGVCLEEFLRTWSRQNPYRSGTRSRGLTLTARLYAPLTCSQNKMRRISPRGLASETTLPTANGTQSAIEIEYD